eukprot:CAMPEP_0116020380 /NCGR_PEP_ID=MMETSP0321-20121206/9760_1 /TAXON_ID=163516 /ORGANISM="Leptocylindrus danicus var. danicus, Strain B650" /LENGTH=547 /DNA_ID=CAMNT_0003491055 /DNA_START=366 /DNA_END=2010 /DNA_ORIENTATION=+
MPEESTNADDEEDFYALLDVPYNATAQEINRAYKKCSLQYHPDKIAQRGLQVTEADQAKFTRIKEAHEVLADPRRRETYDAVGEQGLKWIEEPFSMDPQEVFSNFANSSVYDRSKIFLLFVAIIGILLLVPILVCLQVDEDLGSSTTWCEVLIPLWIYDAFLFLTHLNMLRAGETPRPEGMPEEEWVDPLPYSKRRFIALRHILKVTFEILVALRLDDVIECDWSVVFLPLWIFEALNIRKKMVVANLQILTIEDLEVLLGKPFSEFTPEERDAISGKDFAVVPSMDSPQAMIALKMKTMAQHDLLKIFFRDVFLVLLILQLDDEIDWSWWAVFTPFWILSCCVCCGAYMQLNIAQAAATAAGVNTDLGNADGTTNYGAFDDAESGQQQGINLTEAEKEELRERVRSSASNCCNTCCNQAFVLLIVCLLVGKANGAGYAAIWIISPILFIAGLILCCLGCAIYCLRDVPETDIDMQGAFPMTYDSNNNSVDDYVPPKVIPTSPSNSVAQAAAGEEKTTDEGSSLSPTDLLGGGNTTDAPPGTLSDLD